MNWRSFLAMLTLFCVSTLGFAEEKKFSELTGPLTAKSYTYNQGTAVPMPWITWGGDTVTFAANGNSATTKPDSTFGQMGLKLQLTQGDDFVGQVKDYVTGKTPFVRGTFRMLGQASETLNASPGSKPVILLQETWSLGDHIVFKEDESNLERIEENGRFKGYKVKTPTTISGLKGKKIILQTGGPHVGLLDDTLRTAKLTWDDITPVWVPDLTGPNGPAEALRQGKGDAACVITPDMIGLCSDLDQVGSGSEGTVKGGRVINSTSAMNRSIADVVAARKDFFDTPAGRDVCEKFVAGYLKEAVKVVGLRKGFNDSNQLSPEYKSILQFAQQQFGREVIPTLEIDGHGLLLDAQFVGLSGNLAFFDQEGNLNGFEAKLKNALDLATGQGYASTRAGFEKADFDWKKIADMAGLEYVEPKTATSRIKAEGTEFFPDSAELDDRTILSFTISFEPNQQTFPIDQYGAEFERALQAQSDFGNSVIVVIGHSDPTQTLIDLIKAGVAKGTIRRTGQRGSYKYFFNGKSLDLTKTATITSLIEAGSFDGASPNPKDTMQLALNLSQKRAAAAIDGIKEYAGMVKDPRTSEWSYPEDAKRKIPLDNSQFRPEGAGIADPIIPKPKNLAEAKNNMRVEFRIVRIPAEAVKESDFDY